ncbi:BZ3500_MvSof-1268-A1-R1_Chr1-3g02318 [Microbotryum saponariae]|uniref:BZ3500_MvSof-1268-A1-R1_Chr1-3g02318 protein n=1 Tax=Microbotryum saponariae TaxID=289078 RepID=A0A2X0MV26_9BASI|nr:BZ3500_MvSof-1268-A1-R1_Chr1-3g02318 [Microbotryum saponariae]SCZ95975.1 BZ3501_MvSof-1269-A2-R1_Chr1-3g01921 [Microbotryum saponariae]
MAAIPPSKSASPTSISALASTPSHLLRRASSAASESFSTTTSASGAPGTATGERKRRTRNLLQNYKIMAQGGHGQGGGMTNKGDPYDIDSPESFSPDMYFHRISNNASLPELLRQENELLNGESENSMANVISGPRHGALPTCPSSPAEPHPYAIRTASDTIRKMKSRAEALDASLDSLKSAFQSIAQLSDTLAPNTVRTIDLPTSPNRSLPPITSKPTADRSRLDVLSEDPSPPSRFDPLIHLPALLSLPILLKALLVNDRARADSLWGLWEPALRSWEDEEVQGVKEIGMECREALRRGRSGSLSVGKAQGLGTP